MFKISHNVKVVMYNVKRIKEGVARVPTTLCFPLYATNNGSAQSSHHWFFLDAFTKL